MSVEAEDERAPARVVNIPNALSVARLGFGVGALVLITTEFYAWALAIFLIAAVTDALDGYVARALNQVTAFGRQLDPLIDKLLIASMLIFLVDVPGSGVAAWMVTVIVVRELVIQWLRSLMEGRGIAFGAKSSGKLKTIAQCAAIVAALLVLAMGSGAPQWLAWTRDGILWAAVLLTIQSGVAYVWAAAPRLAEDPRR